ncbi:hypothetical protein U1Q18_029278 [Sarracenia purpurea var. burkii]
MAETPVKRQREETHIFEDNEDSKRHKSYDHILSLLEEEEEEEDHHHHHYRHPNQEFSSILTTLQREISCDSTASNHPLPLPSSAATDGDGDGNNPMVGSSSATSELGRASLHGEAKGVEEEEEEEEERGEGETERFMRRLLEASDDELGIPNRVGSGDDEGMNGGDDLSLWELEDEAASYYTLFQSELFL